MRLKLLDCTLRDGGYVNNWDFSKEEYDYILASLIKAKVECVEVGIMGNDQSPNFNTKFASYSEIPSIAREGSSTIFTVMTTVGEAESIPVPYRTKESVDAIRIAFFKPDLDRMLKLADNVKAKGYKLFIQAMATYMYNETELAELLSEVNQIGADAFYLVDSFGTLYPDDVKGRCKEIDAQLDPRIGLGFHAHNNIQLALANDIAFLNAIRESERQEVYLDATIYGMGRGAGNTPLELLCDYLNLHFEKNYDASCVLDVYKNVISKKYSENKWGYDYLFYLTSKLKINMVYVWYLREIKRLNDETIAELLYRIPEQNKYTLNKEMLNGLLEENNKND